MISFHLRGTRWGSRCHRGPTTKRVLPYEVIQPKQQTCVSIFRFQLPTPELSLCPSLTEQRCGVVLPRGMTSDPRLATREFPQLPLYLLALILPLAVLDPGLVLVPSSIVSASGGFCLGVMHSSDDVLAPRRTDHGLFRCLVIIGRLACAFRSGSRGNCSFCGACGSRSSRSPPSSLSLSLSLYIYIYIYYSRCSVYFPCSTKTISAFICGCCCNMMKPLLLLLLVEPSLLE